MQRSYCYYPGFAFPREMFHPEKGRMRGSEKKERGEEGERRHKRRESVDGCKGGGG